MSGEFSKHARNLTPHNTSPFPVRLKTEKECFETASTGGGWGTVPLPRRPFSSFFSKLILPHPLSLISKTVESSDPPYSTVLPVSTIALKALITRDTVSLLLEQAGGSVSFCFSSKELNSKSSTQGSNEQTGKWSAYMNEQLSK